MKAPLAQAFVIPPRLGPPCGSCEHLEPNPLDSGICYCWRRMTWEFPASAGCDHHQPIEAGKTHG